MKQCSENIKNASLFGWCCADDRCNHLRNFLCENTFIGSMHV